MSIFYNPSSYIPGVIYFIFPGDWRIGLLLHSIILFVQILVLQYRLVNLNSSYASMLTKTTNLWAEYLHISEITVAAALSLCWLSDISFQCLRNDVLIFPSSLDIIGAFCVLLVCGDFIKFYIYNALLNFWWTIDSIHITSMILQKYFP